MPKKFWKGLAWGIAIALILWGLILLGISHAATFYVDCNANGDAGTRCRR